MTRKTDYRHLGQIERIRTLRQARLQRHLSSLRGELDLLTAQEHTIRSRRQDLADQVAGSSVANTLVSGHRTSGEVLKVAARRRRRLAAEVERVDQELGSIERKEQRLTTSIGECQTELERMQRRVLRLQELIRLIFPRGLRS